MEHGAASVQRELSEVPFPGMAGSSQGELGHHFMQLLILPLLSGLRKKIVTYPSALFPNFETLGRLLGSGNKVRKEMS